MARTYSDTPEPRYVKRAEFTENLIHETFLLSDFTHDTSANTWTLAINEDMFNKIANSQILVIDTSDDYWHLYHTSTVHTGSKITKARFIDIGSGLIADVTSTKIVMTAKSST